MFMHAGFSFFAVAQWSGCVLADFGMMVHHLVALVLSVRGRHGRLAAALMPLLPCLADAFARARRRDKFVVNHRLFL